jgi:hypothetical protein
MLANSLSPRPPICRSLSLATCLLLIAQMCAAPNALVATAIALRRPRYISNTSYARQTPIATAIPPPREPRVPAEVGRTSLGTLLGDRSCQSNHRSQLVRKTATVRNSEEDTTRVSAVGRSHQHGCRCAALDVAVTATLPRAAHILGQRIGGSATSARCLSAPPDLTRPHRQTPGPTLLTAMIVPDCRVREGPLTFKVLPKLLESTTSFRAQQG